MRTTAFPTSSDRASSSAPRIVNAWSFAVGMVASEIGPWERCGSRRRRLRTRRAHSRSDTGSGHQEFEWLSCMRCCNRSADDSIRDGSSPQQARARQNVIFELGFFIGALGPNRVAALVSSQVERPSDFDGVVYIPLEAEWRLPLCRELRAAGYEVDLNKVL